MGGEKKRALTQYRGLLVDNGNVITNSAHIRVTSSFTIIETTIRADIFRSGVRWVVWRIVGKVIRHSLALIIRDGVYV